MNNNNTTKMTWNDITYRQLLAIRDTNSIEDPKERGYAIIEAIFGEDAFTLPLEEFNRLPSKLEFMKQLIPEDLHIKTCRVNGRDYEFKGLVGDITAALYIDFQNHMKAKDETKAFSVFFIPKGHKYNDGYDMQQVFNDILDTPAPVLTSASFFFKRQLSLFIKIFRRYSIRRIKRLKLPKEKKKSLLKIMETLDSLESFLIFSNSVK